MKNIQKAKNGFIYLRIVIPKDVRSLDGASEVFMSLKTKDITKAEIIAKPLIEYYKCLLIFCRTKGLKMFWSKEEISCENDISLYFYTKLSVGNMTLEMKGDKDDKKDILDLLKTFINSGSTSKTNIKPLEIKSSPLIDYYFDDYLNSLKRQKLSDSTIVKRTSSLRKLRWMLDKSTRIANINLDLVRHIVKIIFAIPDINLADHTVENALKLGLPPRGHAICAMDCRFISYYFDWLVNEGHLELNPFNNIKLPKPPKTLETSSYVSFTHEDLEKIFGLGLTKEARLYPEYYWLPVLGLYTGARLNEIFQLTVDDIFLDGPVPYIDININGNKTIKNRTSIRKIPIHPKLFELKFDEFVEAVKKDKVKNLFCSATSFSGRFRSYTRKLGINDKKKVFHSFRHGFISELQLNHVSLEVRQALAGHAPKTITENVYGTSVSLKDLYEGIKTIDFKLNIPTLANSKAHSRIRRS